MKSKILLLLVVALIFSSQSFADLCSGKSCPSGRQETSICFSDAEVYSGVVSKVDVHASCGYFTKVVVTKTTTDIKNALNQLNSECKTVKKLLFAGHGNDGYQLAGELDQGTVQDLRDYSCLFSQNAQIDFMGCLVGKGCSGDMLLYQTARTLLSKKGGSVTAPTQYSVGFPGIIPHFSLNGKYRKINYNPTGTPPDQWTQSGIAISDGGNINERCSSDLKDLIENYSEAKNKATKKGCGSSYNYVGQEKIDGYRTIQRRLAVPPPYLQTAKSDSWYDLSNALDSLKYQIRRYEQCEPPSNSTGKTGIWESTRGVR